MAGDKGTVRRRAGMVQPALPSQADHPQWQCLCLFQGHMKGESQLPAASFACGCELEGLGVVPSALEAF